MGPGTDCVGERRVGEEVKAALARWVFLGLIRGLQLQLSGLHTMCRKTEEGPEV